MSLRMKEINEESKPEHGLLSVFNGFCKINLEVPQISLFYTSDNLIPINANVVTNSFMYKNTVDNMADIFKNLKINDPAGLPPVLDEFEMYSNSLQKQDENRCSLSPKNKRKKNKNKTYYTNDIQSLSSTYTEFNASLDYNDQFKNGRLEGGSQDQELKKKPMKMVKNSHLKAQISQQNPKNEEIEHDTGLDSQCPLCFVSFPTLDIELHASRCSPE